MNFQWIFSSVRRFFVVAPHPGLVFSFAPDGHIPTTRAAAKKAWKIRTPKPCTHLPFPARKFAARPPMLFLLFAPDYPGEKDRLILARRWSANCNKNTVRGPSPANNLFETNNYLVYPYHTPHPPPPPPSGGPAAPHCGNLPGCAPKHAQRAAREPERQGGGWGGRGAGMRAGAGEKRGEHLCEKRGENLGEKHGEKCGEKLMNK